MRFFSLVAVAIIATSLTSTLSAAEPWRDLFNGKDLAGWDTWLRAEHKDGGEQGDPIGLNQDPVDVFTIPEPGVLRVSGEVFGCISSHESFSDCHVRFDFRWGEKKWPPRVEAKRDSGFLYHCVGDHGAFWKAWKRCVECQVQEGDVGDFFFLAGTRGRSSLHPTAWRLYDPAGEMSEPDNKQIRHSGRKGHGSGARHESKHGEWNTVQTVIRGDTGVHLVNGFVVNRGFDYTERTGDGYKPLTAGQFQFQSEAAEVYYRRIQVRPAPAKGPGDGASLAAMTPSATRVTGATTIDFRNTGSEPVEVVGVELYGEGAGSWSVILPETPVTVAPGEAFSTKVSVTGQGPDTEKGAMLRLEGMDGPATQSVELAAE